MVQKLKLSIDCFYKKCAPKQLFFNEKKNQTDPDNFWHRKFTPKVQNWHCLTNCPSLETQNSVISFDYSQFLAKNLVFQDPERQKVNIHYHKVGFEWKPDNEILFYLINFILFCLSRFDQNNQKTRSWSPKRLPSLVYFYFCQGWKWWSDRYWKLCGIWSYIRRH